MHKVPKRFSAQLFPEQPLPGCSRAEERVFRALAGLPHPWRVFHSVAWQGHRDGRQGDGEADFVLLHADHGLLVVEVKGGGVAVERGRWISVDATGQRHAIKNPYVQAAASKHALVNYLKISDPRLPFIPAGHAIALPDIDDNVRLGPAANPDVTWLRGDLRNPKAAANRLLEHWKLSAHLRADEVEVITSLLAPTTEARVSLRGRVEDSLAELVRLTDDQIRTLGSLRRNRRALIYGGAGTGKTVLAVEQARRLAASGFSVLLTCYNRPLGEHLAESVRSQPSIRVASFHMLCSSKARDAGLAIPTSPSQDWWDDDLPELLPEAAARTGFSVDAVVVDEGQDFRPAWFTALQLLLRDPNEGFFYVFADEKQAIYCQGWEPPFSGPAFDLLTNCRNTSPVARVVSAVFGDDAPSLGAAGPEPEWISAEQPEDVLDKLRRTIHRLVVPEGFSPTQIVVLASRKALVEQLQGRTLAGQHLTGLDEGGLIVESIHRFKGLEADVVIALIPSLAADLDRALAYIGISRARAHLVVIGPPRVLSGLRGSS